MAHSHNVDGKMVPCNNHVFGPYGDKALHGSKLAYGTAKSDPNKRDASDTLKHDAWCFTYYTPANAAELGTFVKSKPDNVMALVDAALKSDARQDSWQENRGGSLTADIRLPDGTVSKRVALPVLNALKAAGVKYTILPRESKDATSK